MPTHDFSFASVAVVALFASCAPALAINDGFVELKGDAANRFLIGKSAHYPSDWGQDSATYFSSEKELVARSPESENCSVEGWGIFGKSDFRILVTKDALASKPKRGAVIGYYIIGNPRIPLRREPDNKIDFTIVAGNVTGCLAVFPEHEVTPLTLSGDERRLVPAMIVEPASAVTLPVSQRPDISVPKSLAVKRSGGTVGEAIAKLVVGNVVVWPAQKGEACNFTQYFSSDGRIFSRVCFGRGGHIEEDVKHWRVANDSFLVGSCDVPDSDDCDPLVLRKLSAKDGQTNLQVSVSDDRGPKNQESWGLVFHPLHAKAEIESQ
jgi:hypothetical protein